MPKPNKTNIEVTDSGSLKALKKEPTTTCNARLRYSDGYCDKPAGSGTTHDGTGRCNLHGGNSLGKQKTYFSATELLGSDTESTTILNKLQSISEEDPKAVSQIDNEINVLRSLFYRYIKKCETESKLPHPGDLKKFTECLAKMLEIKAKTEEKVKPNQVDPDIFRVYVNMINNILKNRITDPILLNQIADDLEKLGTPEDHNNDQS